MPRLREFRFGRWAGRALQEFLEDSPELIAIDTETSGVEFYDEAFSAQVTWRAPTGELKSWYFELSCPSAEYALHLLLKQAPVWVGHNLKFDLQKLLLTGVITEADIDGHEIHDTQTMYALLDENGRKGLKHLAVTVLKHDDTIMVPYASGEKKGQLRPVSKEKYRLDATRRKLKLKKEDGYHLLPRDVLIPYALKDTEFTLRLYETLWPRLEAKRDEKLLELYEQAMRLKRALLRREAEGFELDMNYLREKTSEYGVLVMEAWQRVIDLTGEPELNPNAPNQLEKAFRKRGVAIESTAEAVLKTMDDDLARAILEYRRVKKIHTTYLSALLKSQRDGRVHPSFNDDGARTGRMSSGSAKE